MAFSGKSHIFPPLNNLSDLVSLPFSLPPGLAASFAGFSRTHLSRLVHAQSIDVIRVRGCQLVVVKSLNEYKQAQSKKLHKRLRKKLLVL